MASLAKLVRMPGAEELSPELRDFLDRVIVPALLRRYLAETAEDDLEENSLALEARTVGNSGAFALSSASEETR